MKEATPEESGALETLKERLRILKALNARRRELGASLQRLREEISAEFLLFYAKDFRALRESLESTRKQEQALRENCAELAEERKNLAYVWSAFLAQTPEEKKHNFRALILQENIRKKAREQEPAEATQELSKGLAKQNTSEQKLGKS